MAKITDRIFGSEQKKQLLALGCTKDTEIEILIANAHYGDKLVRFNGQSHRIY